MKKILMIALCLGIMPMLFAVTNADDMAPNHAEKPDHVFRADNIGTSPYPGQRSTPTLVDQISLAPINGTGYCWGITYDWEIDALWVSQWNTAYPWVYAIQKTSPCTKVDSFQLGSGAPSYHLGMGFAGGGILYMAGYNNSIYEINMTTGAGTVFRTLPWSAAEGLGFNSVDDAVYPGDWVADQCAWAQPAQTGSWNTWSFSTPSGLTGAYNGSMSPEYLFIVDENTSLAHFYQHSVSGGVPNTVPDSVWDCDPGQTQASTADCAFDGQYVYILDQSGPDMIWVYDVGITPQTTVTWDFETGWQGWTHTNGATFPAAWDVEDAYYQGTYVCPNPDDSSMWIDSDAAGSGYGWIGDTCLSPVLIPLASMDWLWYGWCYNDVGTGDWFEAGIKYYDGSSWNVVPLATYTADNYGSYDSVDVSSYAGYSFVQVYFYYDDANTWAWYAAFDNVTIAATVFVPSDDVGTTAINAPGTMIMPNTTLDPTATYENFGTDTETFDVYFEIDSSGVNIYNETANITLGSGVDTTISFASWTCGPHGAQYDVTAYTVFAADINPSNDTLTQTTDVSAAFWEILASIPTGTSGHSESTVHDGTYIVSGFHPSGSYPSTIYEYDIATDTWATVASNPYGCGAYGMAYGVLGNHYRICGTDGWPTGLTRVDIYDPISDTWSAGASAPMANMDQIGGVYNDSLIFMFGGGNWGGQVTPHTNVHFYDIYSDAWTTATNFTGQGRGCLAGGVVGDYAIVACGYDGTSNYLADYIVGNIDPSNPANITWGSQTPIPGFEGRYRVSSGVDYPATGNQQFWVTCGQGNSSPQCSDIWSYEPISDTWTNWNMPKNLAIGNVNSVAITSTALDDIGVYVVGGYTGSYVTDHEVFHTGKVSVEEMPGQQEPSAVFGFAANMKNPVDGYSAITYTTTKPGKVMVKVYDGTGRLVKTLVNRGQEPAGTKTVYWNAKDDGSRTVANGVYFVRLEAEGKVDTHKMILVK